MRCSDEEYQVGEIFIYKETGERFVCVDLKLCEDTYFDVIYIISEEEFLDNIDSNIRKNDLSTFGTIESYEVDDYKWVKGVKYRIEAETVYRFEKLD